MRSINPVLPFAASLVRAGVLVLVWSCIGVNLTSGGEGDTTVKRLIGALASGNPIPEIRGRSSRAVYPQGYSDAAEETVAAARAALVAKGPAAFAELIQHSDDKRYSWTGYDVGLRNFSVGDTCVYIIARQVEVFRWMRVDRPGDHVLWVPRGDKERLVEWWKLRQNEPLIALQIEAVRWCIDEVRAQTYRDEHEVLRRERLTGLQKLLEHLEATREPVLVDGDGHFITNRDLETPPRTKGSKSTRGNGEVPSTSG